MVSQHHRALTDGRRRGSPCPPPASSLCAKSAASTLGYSVTLSGFVQEGADHRREFGRVVDQVDMPTGMQMQPGV